MNELVSLWNGMWRSGAIERGILVCRLEGSAIRIPSCDDALCQLTFLLGRLNASWFVQHAFVKLWAACIDSEEGVVVGKDTKGADKGPHGTFLSAAGSRGGQSRILGLAADLLPMQFAK